MKDKRLMYTYAPIESLINDCQYLRNIREINSSYFEVKIKFNQLLKHHAAIKQKIFFCT